MKLKVMTRKQLVSFLIFRENLIIIIIIIFCSKRSFYDGSVSRW